MALDLLEAVLRRKPEYVLLDAAQDPQILAFLGRNQTEWRSLYEGQSAYQLAAQAPYLSTVPGERDWVAELLRKYWGRGCVTFVSCDLPIDDMRKHFRRFLYVQNAAGEQLYFRFYDPRILRAFLPTCTPDQLAEFLGAIRQFIVEGDEPTDLSVLDAKDRNLVNRTAKVSLEGLQTVGVRGL